MNASAARPHRVLDPRRTLVAALAACLLPALPAAGQEAEPPQPDALCFNGGPARECSTFVVLEMQAVLPTFRSTRRVRWYGGYEADETPFGERLQWELGFMHNVTERWALGGTVRLGPGSVDALTGLAVRGRRWLNPDVGLDLSGGVTFLQRNSPARYGRTAGLMADARINFKDDAYAGIRFEQIGMDGYQGPEDTFDPGGTARAVSLLLGTGSEWTLGGSAALAAWIAIVLASVGYD